MEALTTPKTTYLLEAGLDVLHDQSKEWLSELDFLKIELRFFLKLLNAKIFTLEKDQQRQNVLKNMDRLCTTVLHELEQQIKTHEKSLSVLLTATEADDAQYRDQHKQLHQKMHQFVNDVKSLKMLVFLFVGGLK